MAHRAHGKFLAAGKCGTPAGGFEDPALTQLLPRKIEVEDIASGLRTLGLEGRSAAVHSSLSSFGTIRGGAEGLLSALVRVLDTVLVPAFCWDASAPPPPQDEGIERNAMGPDYFLSLPKRPRPFDPATSPLDRGMGILPRTLADSPKAFRSAHPLNSWAALGSQAPAFTAAYDGEDPYRPLKRLEEAGGFVLLLGVGLESCTALHLAEERSGRKIFLRWVKDAGGRTQRVRTGTCSRGFGRLKPALWPLGREIRIGTCAAWAAPAGQLAQAATAEIRRDPYVTVCGSGCLRCQAAALGGPVEKKG